MVNEKMTLTHETLEREWEKYSGLKNFLKYKPTSFGFDLNDKYKLSNNLIHLDDRDLYDKLRKELHKKKDNQLRQPSFNVRQCCTSAEHQQDKYKNVNKLTSKTKYERQLIINFNPRT